MNRYVLLGTLDGILTAMILSAGSMIGTTVLTYHTALAVVVISATINGLMGLIAEYSHQRLIIAETERALLLEKGRLLGTRVHQSAIVETIRSSSLYAATSALGAATVTLPALISAIAGLASAFTLLVILAYLLYRATGGSLVRWMGTVLGASVVALAVGSLFPMTSLLP